MFNPEAEIEKEEARLEGAVVEAARERVHAWRALVEMPLSMRGTRARPATQRYLQACDSEAAAVDALERHLRGEYG